MEVSTGLFNPGHNQCDVISWVCQLFLCSTDSRCLLLPTIGTILLTINTLINCLTDYHYSMQSTSWSPDPDEISFNATDNTADFHRRQAEITRTTNRVRVGVTQETLVPAATANQTELCIKNASLGHSAYWQSIISRVSNLRRKIARVCKSVHLLLGSTVYRFFSFID